MKPQLAIISLFVTLFFICCAKSIKISVAPDGLQQSIKKVVAEKGENLSVNSLEIFSYPKDDNSFFVVFSTDKADGWFLFAQRKYVEGQVYWQITNPTSEQIENFNQ